VECLAVECAYSQSISSMTRFITGSL